MSQERTAIVIGAGVVGMATCYALARRGWRVTLIDQQHGPGLGASYANGAQLSYCYTDALASPGVLRTAMLSMLKGDGLKLSPIADPAFVSWLINFVSNCNARRFAQNTLAGLQLALESRDAMDALLAAFPIDFGHKIAGKMQLYFSASEFAKAQKISALKAEHGARQLALSAGEAIELEPALSGDGPPITGAIYTTSEEVGDAYRFCVGLLHILCENFSLETDFGQPVTRLETSERMARIELGDGRELTADMAVICAAGGSEAMLRPLGIPVPIQPMKGYSFEMPLTDASPKISLTDTKRRIVFTNLGDRMRVAGFADLGNVDKNVDPSVSHRLVAAAQASLAKAGDYGHVTNHWAGLRPMTPNSLPIIARLHPALALNSGHGMLGWTLAMGSSERLAKLLD